MIPRFPAAVPEIPVTELTAAAEYYRDRLGFTIEWIADHISLAGLSRDDCRIFLAGPSFRSARGSQAPVQVWLNLDSNDAVDALHRTWSAAGALLLTAPESKPFGLHEFYASDPDGNTWRVFHDYATPEGEGRDVSTA